MLGGDDRLGTHHDPLVGLYFYLLDFNYLGLVF